MGAQAESRIFVLVFCVFKPREFVQGNRTSLIDPNVHVVLMDQQEVVN